MFGPFCTLPVPDAPTVMPPSAADAMNDRDRSVDSDRPVRLTTIKLARAPGDTFNQIPTPRFDLAGPRLADSLAFLTTKDLESIREQRNDIRGQLIAETMKDMQAEDDARFIAAMNEALQALQARAVSQYESSHRVYGPNSSKDKA